MYLCIYVSMYLCIPLSFFPPGSHYVEAENTNANLSSPMQGKAEFPLHKEDIDGCNDTGCWKDLELEEVLMGESVCFLDPQML